MGLYEGLRTRDSSAPHALVEAGIASTDQTGAGHLVGESARRHMTEATPTKPTNTRRKEMNERDWRGRKVEKVQQRRGAHNALHEGEVGEYCGDCHARKHRAQSTTTINAHGQRKLLASLGAPLASLSHEGGTCRAQGNVDEANPITFWRVRPVLRALVG